ncbi:MULTISPECIES: hypothetical protein [Thermoactinomyces]|uniref:Uncharacterized protein n=1 Tax=Thermoactinomyces daqus TaxID=1329516 RepID=A0A7W1X9Y6_9BACL|nr:MULTISPECIES: hypothetical protein [Thermoactinomyces]MBA4542853.1 hypothetical protein [Thermoactinomyces daqus]MBH8596701.1 hypothetical protein [Thermoactinomyces sp. CICC 10523]MBH8603463.1 hypothetical protein [Thermoactinomyces sp. CICC 10522]MBH8606628.1 hypothetical protein [Thermoactinomyces sp. CICC 10521]
MEQKYLFGYFRTMEAAKQAAQALKENGFEAYIDRFSPLGGGNLHDRDDDLKNPFTDPTMSLQASTLGGDRSDRDILKAVHPDASGLSGGQPFDSMEDVCVTVFTEPERSAQAQQILEQFGARD